MSLYAPRSYISNTTTVAGTAMPTSSFFTSASDVTPAERAVIGVISAPVMLSYSTIAPTSLIGIPIDPQRTYTINGQPNIQLMQLIRQGSTSATVTITLERE